MRCVGALGSLAARKGVSVEENQVNRCQSTVQRSLINKRPSLLRYQAIGSAFFHSLSAISSSDSTASRVEMTAQLLDTIFDVYGDEERDYDAPVFRKGGFLPLLERILPESTKMVSCSLNRCVIQLIRNFFTVRPD